VKIEKGAEKRSEVFDFFEASTVAHLGSAAATTSAPPNAAAPNAAPPFLRLSRQISYHDIRAKHDLTNHPLVAIILPALVDLPVFRLGSLLAVF